MAKIPSPAIPAPIVSAIALRCRDPEKIQRLAVPGGSLPLKMPFELVWEEVASVPAQQDRFILYMPESDRVYAQEIARHASPAIRVPQAEPVKMDLETFGRPKVHTNGYGEMVAREEIEFAMYIGHRIEYLPDEFFRDRPLLDGSFPQRIRHTIYYSIAR